MWAPDDILVEMGVLERTFGAYRISEFGWVNSRTTSFPDIRHPLFEIEDLYDRKLVMWILQGRRTVGTAVGLSTVRDPTQIVSSEVSRKNG